MSLAALAGYNSSSDDASDSEASDHEGGSSSTALPPTGAATSSGGRTAAAADDKPGPACSANKKARTSGTSNEDVDDDDADADDNAPTLTTCPASASGTASTAVSSKASRGGIDSIEDEDDLIELVEHQQPEQQLGGSATRPASSSSSPARATSTSSLFASLPAPKTDTHVLDVEEEEDLSDIKPVQPVRPKKRQIILPKLSDLQDDDDDAGGSGQDADAGVAAVKPKPKILRSSAAGSSLLKLLPKPTSLRPVAVGSKTTLTQLAPHSLSRRPAPPPQSARAGAQPPNKKAREIAIPSSSGHKPNVGAGLGDDDEDNNERGDEGDMDHQPSTSFFSFDEPKLSDEQLRDLIKKEDLGLRRSRFPHEPTPDGTADIGERPEEGPAFASGAAYSDAYQQQQPAASSSSSSAEIPAEALAQLRGRRKEKIEMFDIDASEFTAEARTNLVKNITVEDNQPQPSDSEPTRLHKSKHHITHLAFMAKARETELKNQWSANRMTKRETQQKYGF